MKTRNVRWSTNEFWRSNEHAIWDKQLAFLTSEATEVTDKRKGREGRGKPFSSLYNLRRREKLRQPPVLTVLESKATMKTATKYPLSRWVEGSRKHGSLPGKKWVVCQRSRNRCWGWLTAWLTSSLLSPGAPGVNISAKSLPHRSKTPLIWANHLFSGSHGHVGCSESHVSRLSRDKHYASLTSYF